MRKPSERAQNKIADLPVLPVFFKLQGKTVLLVGGTECALWKADLLRAAGAHLRLVAPNFVDGFQDILSDQGGVDVHRRQWEEGDFQSVSLAIGSFEEDADAAEFSRAARAYGVPVNTVDKPDHCDFQFGSIVNRAPVVVAVSTDGAAPSIGQAIRKRLEVLLPKSLGQWAAAAKTMRTEIALSMREKTKRLAFWRSFAAAALTQPAERIAETVAVLQGKQENGGRVTLVGAGPGAADLLTLKAVQALQSADVILFDDLVSDEVLELARREAKRFTVGKRGGRQSCKQDDINAMMVEFAKTGKHVVRLKSGDPMIFGRAGEEISQLERQNIPVDVVPGITTALAVAARTRTSLTHRDHAQGVKFITAHSKKGALPDLDWRACADPATSLMIYMGAGTAPSLASKLIQQGLSAATPVMVAKAVSRPEEQIESLTLDQLRCNTIERDQPVMIGIGKTFMKTEMSCFHGLAKTG